MNILKDFILTHDAVTIKTLNPSYKTTLTQIATDSHIWQHAAFEPAFFEQQWFDRAMNQMSEGQRWPFIVEYKGKLAGSTSFYDMDAKHNHVTIGYTWYTPEYWGTDLNPTVKFLLLSYAFEKLHCVRVEFTVDQRNTRSQKALAKMGGQQEGVLRKHLILPDGSYRNTVVFSIIDSEWPTVKSHLLTRMVSAQTPN